MSDEKPPKLHLIQGDWTDEEQTQAEHQLAGLPEDPDERVAELRRRLDELEGRTRRLGVEVEELQGRDPDR